jgi:hypothetical protein
MSVAFAMPYRESVEKGGFADKLAALPAATDVDAWFHYMDQGGISSVRGFDSVAGTTAQVASIH